MKIDEYFLPTMKDITETVNVSKTSLTAEIPQHKDSSVKENTSSKLKYMSKVSKSGYFILMYPFLNIIRIKPLE